MSKIEKLIAELCPDGVEYKTLGELGAFTRGSGIQKSDFVDEGKPCIHYGQLYTYYGLSANETKSKIAESLYETRKKARRGDLVIATTSENEEDVCKCVAWLGEEPCAVSGDAYIYSHTLDPKYVAHYFFSEHFQAQKKRAITGTKVLRVGSDSMAKFEIPVPPIEIQHEIVRILDSFSELEARKAQYAYYRDRLLSRESLESLDGKPVEMKRLEDVSDTLTGFPFKSKEFEVSGIKVARGINVKRGSMIFDDDNTVCWKSSDGLEKYILNGGDILIAMDGSLVGKSFGMIAESDLPAILGQRVTRVRCSEIDPRFVFHIIASGTLEAMVDKKKTAGAVPHVSLKDIQAIEIPIPSLATQRKVVDILDRFDALTTSLADGIPAEIEARRQQYEYYRDRLLDLPRKDADAA